MVLSDIAVGWPPKGSQILDFEKLIAGCLLHTLASYVSVRPHGPSLPALGFLTERSRHKLVQYRAMWVLCAMCYVLCAVNEFEIS